MADKQLDLGQYKLFHLTEMERIPTAGEVKTMLEPGTPMTEGTVQDTIADVETTVLDYDDRHERYPSDIEGQDYDQFEQDTLSVNETVEGEQPEITAYNNTTRTASD